MDVYSAQGGPPTRAPEGEVPIFGDALLFSKSLTILMDSACSVAEQAHHGPCKKSER